MKIENTKQKKLAEKIGSFKDESVFLKVYQKSVRR